MFYCYCHQHTLNVFHKWQRSGTGIRRLVIFWMSLSYRWVWRHVGKDNEKYVCLTRCCGCSFSTGTDLNAGLKPSWEPVPLSETQVQLPPPQGYLSVYGLRFLSLYLVPFVIFISLYVRWTKCLLYSLWFLSFTAGKLLHGDYHRICNIDDSGWAWIR